MWWHQTNPKNPHKNTFTAPDTSMRCMAMQNKWFIRISHSSNHTCIFNHTWILHTANQICIFSVFLQFLTSFRNRNSGESSGISPSEWKATPRPIHVGLALHLRDAELRFEGHKFHLHYQCVSWGAIQNRDGELYVYYMYVLFWFLGSDESIKTKTNIE